MGRMIEKTIDRVLRDLAESTPDREFIVYSDRGLRWTYGEFDKRVNDLAKGLLAIGLGKGDHVGIWATNVPDWLTFFFATSRIGSVLVTVNTNYKLHELEYLIGQSDIKALAIIDGWRDSDYVKMVQELVPELNLSERGRLTSERFPYLEHVIFLGAKKHRGMYNTQELMLMGSYQEDDEVNALSKMLDCHDVINMQYTSGTTGFPKGVQLTHYNILNNGYNIGECQKFTDREILCLAPPLFHCFGIVLGVMAVLTHGAAVVPIETFDPLVVMASVQKERCTALYGVPTMFIAELNHPMFDLFDLSSLRTGIMAGSLCPMETMKQVIERMNMREITIAYGLTEASPVMTQTRTDDPLEKRVSTVGPALPGIEVRVLDPETGKECPPEVQGELCCRGYNVMKGYYKMPEATAECIDGEGWLHSGDLGIMDEDRFFRVTGRIKDMIIRGGENIYPREIEEFLRPFEEIQDVQVAGVPDGKYGEQVGAFIILKQGRTLTGEEIQDRCRGEISRHKIPRYVFFVDSYPMTGSGKIQKYKMGEMALELLKERGAV